MGTNFFCHKKPTQEYYDNLDKEYIKLEEILKSRDIDAIEEQINKLKKVSKIPEWHIGKRSYGWAFLFQAKEYITEGYCYSDDELYESQVPWKDNIESLKKFISREDIQITNEYDEHFTFDQFWNEEIKDWLYVDDEHLSHETYHKKHPEEMYYHNNYEKVKDNIRWCYCWFG